MKPQNISGFALGTSLASQDDIMGLMYPSWQHSSVHIFTSSCIGFLGRAHSSVSLPIIRKPASVQACTASKVELSISFYQGAFPE